MSNNHAIAWGVSRGPHQESTCWSKELWKKCGPLNHELDYAFDLDFFIKIFSIKIKPIFIPKFVGAWRQWELNKCTKDIDGMNKEILKVKRNAKKSTSLFNNKYFKKFSRRLAKLSQIKFSYISGLPKIGNHISSNSTIKQTFIPILWKTIFSRLM